MLNKILLCSSFSKQCCKSLIEIYVPVASYMSKLYILTLIAKPLKMDFLHVNIFIHDING